MNEQPESARKRQTGNGGNAAVIATLTLNPAVDVGADVQQVVPDHKLRCSRPRFEPGGGGINVSRAIRKLGGESIALWTCGGHTGEHFAGLLAEEGVASQPIPIGDLTRENVIIYEESGNRQFRFCMPGPRLSDAEVEACVRAVAELNPVPQYLVLSGSLPDGVADDLYARIARQTPGDCRVIIDTSGPALEHSLGERVFLVKPNHRELGQLLKRPIDGDDQLRSGARSLIDAGKAQVIVTSLGTGGAVLVTSNDFVRFRSPTVPIRSRVGAGDSMVAGLTHALASGMTLREAVCFGVAAGAAAVTTPGTELCRREDAERLFEELKRDLRKSNGESRDGQIAH